MGCDLAGDVEPARLGVPHERERPPRREMREMQAAARKLGDQEVSGDGRRLGEPGLSAEAEPGRDRALVHGRAARERGILRVLDDRHSEEAGVLEGVPQQRAVGKPLPVVGERDGARDPHFAELRELFPELAAGDRADGIEPRPRLAPRLGRDELRDRAVVDDGVRIGHRADRGKSAGGGGPQPRSDRLRILAARLAQVGVQVDEPRQHNEPGGVERSPRRPPGARSPTVWTTPPAASSSRSSAPSTPRASGSTSRPPRIRIRSAGAHPSPPSQAWPVSKQVEHRHADRDAVGRPARG